MRHLQLDRNSKAFHSFPTKPPEKSSHVSTLAVQSAIASDRACESLRTVRELGARQCRVGKPHANPLLGRVAITYYDLWSTFGLFARKITRQVKATCWLSCPTSTGDLGLNGPPYLRCGVLHRPCSLGCDVRDRHYRLPILVNSQIRSTARKLIQILLTCPKE